MKMSDSPSQEVKPNGVQHLEISDEYAGQRVDNFLLRHLKGVPKSRIYRILRKGEVRVNSKRVKPDARLKMGDKLRIPPVRTSERQQDRNFNLEDKLTKTIIYESKLLLIINKPNGFAVHGGSGLTSGIIEALRHARPEDKHLELVHRLDRGTSGCLMIAKKRAYLKLLQDELRRKTRLRKTYRTVVHGRWPKRKFQVNAPIMRNMLKSGERVSRVMQGGKESLTEYEVMGANETLTALQASPVTGRTHQIRVHCRHVGHPVVGDDKYGFEEPDRKMEQKGFKRMMLHACRLEIPSVEGHPAIQIEAPLDDEMSALWDSILSS